MDGLIPICIVDDISTKVLDDLLKSDDVDTTFDHGKQHIFVVQSLQNNDDLYAPMTKSAAAFTSPFLNMTFDDVLEAILLKRETLKEKDDMSPEVFIIVDARSTEDNTVWLCRIDNPDRTSWPPESGQPLEVRTQMNVAGRHGRDLQNNKTTMRRLCAWAAMEKGVLVSPPEPAEEEKQVEKEEEVEEEEEEEEEEEAEDDDDDGSIDSDASQSSSEWGDVWRGRWCN